MKIGSKITVTFDKNDVEKVLRDYLIDTTGLAYHIVESGSLVPKCTAKEDGLGGYDYIFEGYSFQTLGEETGEYPMFRRHRGSLEESLKSEVMVKSLEELAEAAENCLSAMVGGSIRVRPSDISTAYKGRDTGLNHEHSYLVRVSHYGIAGLVRHHKKIDWLEKEE